MIVIILLMLCVGSLCSNYPPEKPPWPEWTQMLISRRIINMTAELLMDTTYKLKHAEKIKDQHSHSITFELGTIAAGIQERFQRMLKIYRKFANLKDYRSAKYEIYEVLNGYHIMQGDYNEIIVEKNIFYEIVRKHESTSKRLPPGWERYTTPPLEPPTT